MGKPSEIAAKYRNNSNEYLISPRYYTDYIKTLKIAIILISALIVLANVLQHLFTANSLDFAKIIEIFISETIEGLFEGAFTAFTIVTVVFFIVLTALDLAVGIHKMSTGIKTYSIVIFNGVKNVLTIIFISLLFTTKSILNHDLFNKISEFSGVELNKVIDGYNIGLTATRIGFGIILIGYIIYVIWQINKLKNIEKAINN